MDLPNNRKLPVYNSRICCLWIQGALTTSNTSLTAKSSDTNPQPIRLHKNTGEPTNQSRGKLSTWISMSLRKTFQAPSAYNNKISRLVSLPWWRIRAPGITSRVNSRRSLPARTWTMCLLIRVKIRVLIVWVRQLKLHTKHFRARRAFRIWPQFWGNRKN